MIVNFDAEKVKANIKLSDYDHIKFADDLKVNIKNVSVNDSEGNEIGTVMSAKSEGDNIEVEILQKIGLGYEIDSLKLKPIIWLGRSKTIDGRRIVEEVTIRRLETI